MNAELTSETPQIQKPSVLTSHSLSSLQDDPSSSLVQGTPSSLSSSASTEGQAPPARTEGTTMLDYKQVHHLVHCKQMGELTQLSSYV